MNMKRLLYISCLLIAVSCSQKLDNSYFIPGMDGEVVNPDQNVSGPATPDVILPNQVKVMSFNVRVGTENGTDPQDWPARRKSVKPLLTKENPTVIGLQEALKHQMDYISLEMEDYGAYGLGRDDGNSSGEIMTILWNRKQVFCERMGTFWLSPTPDQVSLGWDAGYKRTATWGEFTVLATNQRFFYLNTHVDNTGNLARVQSIALIKEKIKELNPYGFPVIVTGDFNAGLEHAMFEPFNEWLYDARSTSPITDTRATYHGFGKYSTKIDHIFYTGLTPLEYETLNKTYEGVTYISDHYPIAALFELKGSANPDDPQAPGNYGDLTEEDLPLNDYNEPPHSDGSYGDLKEEDYPLQ